MVHWNGYDWDDGIRPIDADEVYDEVHTTTNYAIEATGDESIEIEVNLAGGYDVELKLFCSRVEKPTWVGDIEDIKHTLVKLYPEADWEDLGWS